jgi:prophage regulatory protein
MAKPNDTPTLLRLPALAPIIVVGRSATYDAIRFGTMVPPVKLSARAVAFPSDEVAAVVAARSAGATDAQMRALVQRLVAERPARLAAILRPTAPVKR